MASMKHIVLIYGGRSGEHEVSLRSGAFIYHNIKKSGLIPHPVGITPKGIWYYQEYSKEPADILPLEEKEENRLVLIPGIGLQTVKGEPVPCDIVFPVIHGTFGEDGTLQGLLEMMDIPYAGAGLESSALGMDKICAKEIWENAGLPVVPYEKMDRHRWEKSGFVKNAFYRTCCEKLGLPLFIKPSRAGSSVGVTRAEDEASFLNGIESALLYDREILIEKAVNAREIECSLLGRDDPEVFGPGEIAPHHTFYDYEAKYIDPDGAALLIPAPLDDALSDRIKATAKSAYLALNLNGLARVDIFLEKDSERFYINEVNTMPGFTSISMYPMLCEKDGLKGPELIMKLLEAGMEEYREKSSLLFEKK